MEILLVVSDRLIRDQVKVGLQQFPEFSVMWGEGYAAINQARQTKYDCVFLEIPPQAQDGTRLLQHLRSFDTTTELVVITSERSARDMAKDKSAYNIAAFLHTPIDVAEFFRMVARLRARHNGTDVAAPATR